MEAIRKAKRKQEAFIKCGGVWIAISDIVLVSDRVAPPDESEDPFWPGPITINIGGIGARIKLQEGDSPDDG